jgi:hypothetical protein
MWNICNCSSSLITNDAKGACEIKSNIAMAEAAFNKKILFTSKLDINLRKTLVSAAFGA